MSVNYSIAQDAFTPFFNGYLPGYVSWVSYQWELVEIVPTIQTNHLVMRRSQTTQTFWLFSVLAIHNICEYVVVMLLLWFTIFRPREHLQLLATKLEHF